MKKNNSDEITQESGLLDIYKAIRFKLPKSNINIFSTLSVLAMLITCVMMSTENSFFWLIKMRKLAETGFSFSTGILGFLIAGFTIFATVVDKNLFAAMAKVIHTKSGLSYLKYNFFILMYVFIVYLGFAILCLLVQLVGDTSGFISIMTKLVAGEEYFTTVKHLLVRIGVVVVGTWFFYSLIILQSFIFNIYHVVVTAIRWEVGDDKI